MLPVFFAERWTDKYSPQNFWIKSDFLPDGLPKYGIGNDDDDKDDHQVSRIFFCGLPGSLGSGWKELGGVHLQEYNCYKGGIQLSWRESNSHREKVKYLMGEFNFIGDL